jgi:PAS domain S-box-containing protein
MLTTDHEGHILGVNAETEQQFGYTRQELIGGPVEKLIPLRLHAAHQCQRDAYQQAPIYRPISGLKLLAVRKDGREFPVDVSLNPVVTESGMVFYCIIRDTSEREAVLDELGRHLKLERALSELITKFINLPANRVDQEITSALQVLVEALDNDGAHLGQRIPP